MRRGVRNACAGEGAGQAVCRQWVQGSVHVRTLEDEDHRQVGDAAAQVAPASGGGVCQADDLLRELLRAPHLQAEGRPVGLVAWGQGGGGYTAGAERGVGWRGWWVVGGGVG